MNRLPLVNAARVDEPGLRLAGIAGRARAYGGAALIAVALATMLLLRGWGVEAGVTLLAAGLAVGFGAPALLLLVAIPVRFHTPGPYHSISFFELAVPFALVHEVVRRRATSVSGLRPVLAIVGMFVVWVLLSGIWSVDRVFWLRSAILLAEGAATGLTFYLWTRRQSVEVVLRSWVLLGAFAAIAAVAWYYPLQHPEWMNLMPPQNPDETRSQFERLGSPFWGPSNYFASMLLLFIPFGFSRRVNTWLRLAIVGVGAIAIVGTLSRGAALAAVVVSPLLFLLVPRSRRPRLPFRARWLLVPAGAAVAVLLAVLLWDILSRPDLRGNFFNDPNRVSYYQDALRLLVQRPVIGAGYGSWPSLVTGSATTGAHNYYLQVAVETGLIGAALFVAAFATVVTRARNLAGDLAFTTMAALLLVAVNITVEASFEGVIFSWLFAMLLGMMLAWPTELESAGVTDVPAVVQGEGGPAVGLGIGRPEGGAD